MTFDHAISLALGMARQQQQPYYVTELAGGWAVASYKPKTGRIVAVEPPSWSLPQRDTAVAW
jgi:hypothetical protein